MFNLKLKKINKISIALFLVLSLGIFNFNIGVTSAYFSDTETSSGNTFSAGTLDISLNNTDAYSSGLMYPNDATTTIISISNTGSLDSQHIASTTLSGSDTTACDYITMTATTPNYSFVGLIKDFISPATTTINTAWNFNFLVSPSAPPSVWGKTCFFKWTYTAWQDNLSNSSSGFSSIKEKLGSIRIGKAVVLNEILPNPTGLDNALMPGGEWVELYNNSNTNINLSGWVIYDSVDTNELYITNSNTNTGEATIGAHNFLVVYKNGDSDFNLNNDADSVRLATGYPIASSIIVDSFSWTAEKPEGFSYARIPDGIGAWVDPIPTPGWTNDFSEILKTILGTTTEELIATSTATSTPISVINVDVPKNATTTAYSDLTASTTENNIVEDLAASTTTEIVTTDPIATTTPEIIIESTSTSTKEIIDSTSTTTTNEAIIPEEPSVIEETSPTIEPESPTEIPEAVEPPSSSAPEPIAEPAPAVVESTL